jgi:hypothetical protein
MVTVTFAMTLSGVDVSASTTTRLAVIPTCRLVGRPLIETFN